MGKIKINPGLVLLVSLIAIVGVYFYTKTREEPETIQQPEVIWDQQRQYPADFTDNEKIVLVPQTDDVPRPAHVKWDTTFQEIAEDVDTLKLVTVGSDCFGRPSVLKTEMGSPINVENTTEADISIGMGEQSWSVPARATITITPVFKILPDFKNYFVYGYGCGFPSAPSGLFYIDDF